MILYVASAVSGSTLIKLGSNVDHKALFVLPVFNMPVSTTTLIGVFAYGISFMTYIVLLTRFDLSFVSPLLIAFVYILLMVTAFVIFQEQFTMEKIIGCILILAGVILVIFRS